ncbi:hypothetical protein LJC32_01290 [Oscillospiraceae bacterium OttesenSCG-928-F05]|nr:hypothetical protein [Oscillospiraceae bacterium OttesenSCG-928-F05]
MNRIPLTERLHLLNEGVDKRAHNIAIIKEMAEMPIARYLAAFEGELERLARLLRTSPENLKDLRYRNVASIIAQSRYDWDVADEAVKILALPFKRYYEERTKNK